MTSNEQLEANRANAKRSSGPRTEVGKARPMCQYHRHRR